MDCQRIKVLLQSVAIMAVHAQQYIDNGDNNGLIDDLELIEGDIKKIYKELDKCIDNS